jgi:membrane protein insertase Oxa1/YidC/SpoIIIJ
MMFMPLMFGFFALQVPQGLALYWVTSNIFSLIQQYFVTGWGGVKSAISPAKESAKSEIESSASDTKRTKKNGKRKRKN